MRKLRVMSLMLVLLVLVCVTALAEWTCPSCSTGNSGKFCTACGAAQPANACASCGEKFASSGYKFCPNCGAAVSSGTSAASATTSSSSLEITGVEELSDGSLRVMWTDSANNGPYDVTYQERVCDDFYSDEQDSRVYWNGEDNVSGKSLTLSYLAPGVDYWICVEDDKGNTALYEYDAPFVPSFSEFGVSISIEPRKRVGGGTTRMDSFSAGDIEKNMGTTAYGAYIKLNFPRLGRARHYNSKVVITDPAGQAIVDEVNTWDLTAGNTDWYYSFYSLDWYFSTMMNHYGSVPTGTYTWTMYFEGKMVNSQNFNVSY